jgi:hypothetical protein
MEESIISQSRNTSRFAVNNIFTVVFWNHVSRSRVEVNGITVMEGPKRGVTVLMYFPVFVGIKLTNPILSEKEKSCCPKIHGSTHPTTSETFPQLEVSHDLFYHLKGVQLFLCDVYFHQNKKGRKPVKNVFP